MESTEEDQVPIENEDRARREESAPTRSRAVLRFHQFGDPTKVLRLETEPVRAPGSGQVTVRLLASPVNPSDLGTIAGSYGQLPELPAVPGREGVGEVVEKGPDTDALTIGQRVLLPEGTGGWRERIAADADRLVAIPHNVPVEQAAMATINPPTALLLLDTFVRLEPGDWVIQNAANSAVGHYVIQLCHARGVRTLNIVRRPAWIERLKAIGADEVLLENEPDLPRRVAEITADRRPRLALNSVGGHSASTLIKCLGDGGTHVTFGGMTGEPVRFPTRYLIFNEVRLVGFWLHRWKTQAPPEKKRAVQEEIFKLMADKTLHAPIEATFPLASFAEAIDRASASGRTGKVLFTG